MNQSQDSYTPEAQVDPAVTQDALAMQSADGISTNDVAWLVRWAGEGGAQLELSGEVGFGRECVGIIKEGSYIDYDESMVWTPRDAYHKHDCLAVLGHGPFAEHQLLEWVKRIAAAGGKIETIGRMPTHSIDAILNGYTSSRIVFS